jgi:hypothetical protein
MCQEQCQQRPLYPTNKSGGRVNVHLYSHTQTSIVTYPNIHNFLRREYTNGGRPISFHNLAYEWREDSETPLGVVQGVVAAEAVINKALFQHPAGGMVSTLKIQTGSLPP